MTRLVWKPRLNAKSVLQAFTAKTEPSPPDVMQGFTETLARLLPRIATKPARLGITVQFTRLQIVELSIRTALLVLMTRVNNKSAACSRFDAKKIRSEQPQEPS